MKWAERVQRTIRAAYGPQTAADWAEYRAAWTETPEHRRNPVNVWSRVEARREGERITRENGTWNADEWTQDTWHRGGGWPS